MDYQKFSDLVKDVPGLDGKNLDDDTANKLVQFYHYWSQYLHPQGAFWAFIYMLPGGIAKSLYQITAALEHVYNNLFKLFGLFGYLGDQQTIIGQIYHYGQLFGLSGFLLVLTWKMISTAWGKKPKYGEYFSNFLLVTFVIFVLPLGITTFGTAIAQDAQTARTMTSNGKGFSSLALQPLKSNVVDLKVLINNDWDTSKFELDDQGNLKPIQKSGVELNYITDNKKQRESGNYVTNLDFTANYGATNTKVLEDMDSENNGAYKGVKGLFLHKLDANSSGLETIDEHRFAKGLNAMESTYMRYQVNWIGMFLQYGLLIFLFLFMAVKLGKSVVDIVLQGMIFPIQGYFTAASSAKKNKELLMTIFSAFMGILFEVIIMRVVLEICRDFPSLSLAAVKGLGDSFFSGLTMWEQVLAAALVYLGTFLAAMQGSSAIERWLGVSTGHSDAMQQVAGSLLMAGALTQGATAFGHGAASAAAAGGKAAWTGTKAAGRGAKKAASGATQVAGALKGINEAVRDQGVGGAFKNGMTNGVRKASDTIQSGLDWGTDKVNGVLDKGADRFDSGQVGAYNALTTDPMDKRQTISEMRENSGMDNSGLDNALSQEAKQNRPPKTAGLAYDPTKGYAKRHASQARSNLGQAKSNLQQGSQQLSSGQNHIKGYTSDED
ncbi:pLS20_p028 family conjugation system transmembrane protein [Streptococcus dentasini]